MISDVARTRQKGTAFPQPARGQLIKGWARAILIEVEVAPAAG